MASEATASVFMSGRSQAIRIPKAFRIDAERVTIRKRGESLVLTPAKREDPWAGLKEAAGTFSKDCFEWEDLPTRGYPRMGMDESIEHFEARVHDYEQWSEDFERNWRERHGVKQKPSKVWSKTALEERNRKIREEKQRRRQNGQ